jgi:hypothetical protein
VFSPQYAIEHLNAALDPGNLALQGNLWASSDAGEVDPRRLVASEGGSVFESEQTMVEAILNAVRRGWIMNAELRLELLAIADAVVRADRVLVAVAIDDAIVAGADSEEIGKAQEMLEQGDALAKEAALWQDLDRKVDLLDGAINQYRDAWTAAVTLLE